MVFKGFPVFLQALFILEILIASLEVASLIVQLVLKPFL